MKHRKPINKIITTKITKLVHGGQGLGQDPNGKKVFIWNSLPGEEVQARIYFSKKDYAEGVAEEIISPNPERIKPKEPNSYLSTSPWQIMDFAYENAQKLEILTETFAREKVNAKFSWKHGQQEFAYRNKMEYGFFGDENGLHFAHYSRGSHNKIITDGSVLAHPAINAALPAIKEELNRLDIRAGDLKTIVLRSNQGGDVVGALYVKHKDLPKLNFKSLKGLEVIFSNPKSPASIITEVLYINGNSDLTDTLSGVELTYNVKSFFQLNPEVFISAVNSIRQNLDSKLDIMDMFSGVGSIGLMLKTKNTMLIESEKENIDYAKQNIKDQEAEIIQARSEDVLEYITAGSNLIVDPPRAGLHKKLTHHITDVKPKVVAYLSCNPATQARDVRILVDSGYAIIHAEGFNFFPRTPHIESLVILKINGEQ